MMRDDNDGQIIWMKGTSFEAVTGHTTKCPQRFPNWGFLGFSSVIRQMPGNLLHCPRCPPYSIITPSFSLQQLIDKTDVTDLGQMAYKAGNPWLWPKLVWSHHSLQAPRALPGRQLRFNIPIQWMNRYQQYNMPPQHMYCRRIWNLILALDAQSTD